MHDLLITFHAHLSYLTLPKLSNETHNERFELLPRRCYNSRRSGPCLELPFWRLAFILSQLRTVGTRHTLALVCTVAGLALLLFLGLADYG